MIRLMYLLGIALAKAFFPLVTLFSSKLRAFTNSRKKEKVRFKGYRRPEGLVYWVHCASHGEYEQVKPLIHRLKERDRAHFFISFFSPSGYEIVKKEISQPDYVGYIPLESKPEMSHIIQSVRPDKVFWVKYELWLRNLEALFSYGKPVYLISAVFRKEHFVGKWWGSPWRRLLHKFENRFVQNEQSREVLDNLGIPSLVVGDTRFDNVLASKGSLPDYPDLERWKKDHRLLVVGSSWHKEENITLEMCKKYRELKVLLAPHDIGEKHIEDIVALLEQLELSFERWSSATFSVTSQVLILDNIGMLSSLYHFADLAFVGGGYGSGLHNILEPLAWGVPVCTGPVIHRNWEAVEAKEAGVLKTVSDARELDLLIKEFMQSGWPKATKPRQFVSNYQGAVASILKFV